MFRIGLGIHITDLFAGTTGYDSTLPPDFSTDPTDPSTLMFYLDGTNADDTHKANLVSIELPADDTACLTLAVGDRTYIPGHGVSVTNMGTAVVAYDDYYITITTGGTLYGLIFADGTIVPCCEGAGETIGSTDGLYVATVEYASDPWLDTQSDYTYTSDVGYYSNGDGVVYPYDPEIFPITPPIPPEILGPELLTNGDGETGDTTGWDVVGTGTITNVSNQFVIGCPDVFKGAQALVSAPASDYKLTLDVKSVSSGGSLWITTQDLDSIVTAVEDNMELYFTATDAIYNIYFRERFNGGSSFTIDNVSLKEVL